MKEHKYPSAEQMVETYKKYIKCFREKDFEGLKEYVAEDIYFFWGMDMPALKGRDQFLNFFKEARKYFDEAPVESNIEARIPMLRAWIDNTLSIHHDWPDAENPFMVFGLQMRAGNVHKTSGYVNYVYNEDGKIAIIIDNDWDH